jgi:hypothetical protein
VARLILQVGGHVLNGGRPIRQPLRIIGDPRPRAACLRDGVEIGRRPKPSTRIRPLCVGTVNCCRDGCALAPTGSREMTKAAIAVTK